MVKSSVLEQTSEEKKAADTAANLQKKFKLRLNGAMRRLLGYDKKFRGTLASLIHGNGDNFNVTFIASKFEDEVTKIYVVESMDNLNHEAIIKLPGGGSLRGEKVEDTLVRESHEECGFWPTEATLIYANAQFSRERKLSEDSEKGWHHHKLAFHFDKYSGFPSLKNQKDHDLRKLELVAVKDLLTKKNFHTNGKDGGHLAILKHWINHVKYADALAVKFPDIREL